MKRRLPKKIRVSREAGGAPGDNGLAEVVTGGEMAAFDVALGRALRRAGRPEWEAFVARVSRLWTPDVVFAATVGGAVALTFRGQPAAAAVWLGARAGTAILVLKALFARTRPHFLDSAVETTCRAAYAAARHGDHSGRALRPQRGPADRHGRHEP